MNYKKMFFTLIWIIVCIVAAAISYIIPQDFQYMWGIVMGCLSMVFARIVFEGDDK